MTRFFLRPRPRGFSRSPEERAMILLGAGFVLMLAALVGLAILFARDVNCLRQHCEVVLVSTPHVHPDGNISVTTTPTTACECVEHREAAP